MAKINISRIRSYLSNFSFALPAILIFSIFYIYPFFKTFQLSLCDYDLLESFSFAKYFVGLRNFRDVATDGLWWESMWHAGVITFIALTFQNALALALALACNREIRARNFYRVLFFIPPVLSEVVVGLIWWWIYDGNYGLLNHWLGFLGLTHLITDWLSNPKTALICVSIVHSWKGFGWGFILLLAGLQTIPRQLYEAARVDGASSWQRFWKITVPLMVPVFVLVMILTILGSMQAFILIFTMTRGGPSSHTEVPVTRILASMGQSNFGIACAQGVIFGIILLLASFTLKKISEKVKQV